MRPSTFQRILLTLVISLAMQVMGPVRAAVPPGSTTAALLQQATDIGLKDHDRFLKTLEELHRVQGRLSQDQKWQLRYLDAWQADYDGNFAKATPILRNIIESSGDHRLKTLATSMMVSIYSQQHRFVEAYELSESLLRQLPEISDKRARSNALQRIIDMLSMAGQGPLVTKLSKQFRSDLDADGNQCASRAAVLNALSNLHKLSSKSTELHRTIALCIANHRENSANTLQLDLAEALVSEGHANRAIALLNRIGSNIRKAGFTPHEIGLDATLARAYLMLGNSQRAEASAHRAVRERGNGAFTKELMTAYQVLYKVNKERGDTGPALAYYEKYVTLHESNLEETKARALAYQMARQDTLTRKLKIQQLSRENRVLKLRQSLDRKSAETRRLHLLLLALVLVPALTLLWAYRNKRSQLRLRRMARRDALSDALNRPSFLQQAESALQRLEKAGRHACLLILDLDHFQRINDMYDHLAGDSVLGYVAQVCRDELRKPDVFGRMGGDEFAILIDGGSRTQAMEMGDRIRRTLVQARMPIREGIDITVTASMGLACTGQSGHALKTLLMAADEALYEAKRAGRNRLMGQDRDRA